MGERLSTLGIDTIGVSTHKSLKSRFRGGAARKIPYGTYLVRVSAPGFRSSEREILLDQPELPFRTQLSISMECVSGVEEIHGTIRRALADRDLWVKLVPLHGVGGAEARVNQDGSFRAGGLGDGQYLLLVIDGEAVVHTDSLVIPLGSPLAVDLVKN